MVGSGHRCFAGVLQLLLAPSATNPRLWGLLPHPTQPSPISRAGGGLQSSEEISLLPTDPNLSAFTRFGEERGDTWAGAGRRLHLEAEVFLGAHWVPAACRARGELSTRHPNTAVPKGPKYPPGLRGAMPGCLPGCNSLPGALELWGEQRTPNLAVLLTKSAIPARLYFRLSNNKCEYSGDESQAAGCRFCPPPSPLLRICPGWEQGCWGQGLGHRGDTEGTCRGCCPRPAPTSPFTSQPYPSRPGGESPHAPISTSISACHSNISIPRDSSSIPAAPLPHGCLHPGVWVPPPPDCSWPKARSSPPGHCLLGTAGFVARTFCKC